jgi:hypothetical protein
MSFQQALHGLADSSPVGAVGQFDADGQRTVFGEFDFRSIDSFDRRQRFA